MANIRFQTGIGRESLYDDNDQGLLADDGFQGLCRY